MDKADKEKVGDLINAMDALMSMDIGDHVDPEKIRVARQGLKIAKLANDNDGLLPVPEVFRESMGASGELRDCVEQIKQIVINHGVASVPSEMIGAINQLAAAAVKVATCNVDTIVFVYEYIEAHP